MDKIRNSELLRLPILVTSLGLLMSILICGLLLSIPESNSLVTPTKQNLLVLVATTSLSLTLVAAILMYLKQVSLAYTEHVNKMTRNLKKEIHERIAIEESKQKLEIALLQGQKLQAIGTLAGGIAHDFNNLLYAIIGYTEMLCDDVPKNTLIYKNLNKIQLAASRGKDLVARILAFSREQHPEFQIIDLKITLSTVLALLQPTIPASIILDCTLLPIKILGNPTQIHQVLINVVNNAIDAMDNEGTIHIKMAELTTKDTLPASLMTQTIENYCTITITDTGYGMHAATIERVFEPFFTTKEVGKGTGLGLSIAYTIIKQHHGDIVIQSELGKGTSVTIFLPVHDESKGNIYGNRTIS